MFSLPRSLQLVRRFVVDERSMLPVIEPGDGLIALRWPFVRRGQIRVFEHPDRANFWLVKRVGAISGCGRAERFEATSEHRDAAGATDSRRLGLIESSGTYLVVKVVRGAKRARID